MAFIKAPKKIKNKVEKTTILENFLKNGALVKIIIKDVVMAEGEAGL
jgi:hypothetical protein